MSRSPLARIGLFLALAVLIAVGLVPPIETFGQTPDTPAELEARRTAVALNYCRASFHRIRRTPSKRVLLEERERILDNLNLNGIADEQVVKLYTEVLDEIGHVEIAERERLYLQQDYRRQFNKTIATSFFGMGLQAATGQFMGALRTGAAGWWDVRSMSYRRDIDEWKIEKVHEQALVDKSSKFLDTFWRLTRDKQIPDRWLVRDSDLDKLEIALRETDPEVRLRVLGRMERYLECYPPYFYYVGRTQQEMGQLFASSESYGRMADVGTGYFRKDELLATGLANRAVIQAYLHQPGAAETARIALRHADDVWQANLACAAVLEQYDTADAAEDAILRNLDVDLEQASSTAQLVGLYHRTHNVTALRRRLADPTDVALVPAPLLAAASAQLARTGTVPDAARQRLSQSLYAYADTRFGPDDLVVKGAGNWWLSYARMGVHVGATAHTESTRSTEQTIHEARFGGAGNFGSPVNPGDPDGPVVVDLRYPDGTTTRVLMQKSPTGGGAPPSNNANPFTSFASSTKVRQPPVNADELPARSDAYVPIAIEVDGQRVSLVGTPTVVPTRVPESTVGPPVAVPAPR